MTTIVIFIVILWLEFIIFTHKNFLKVWVLMFAVSITLIITGLVGVMPYADTMHQHYTNNYTPLTFSFWLNVIKVVVGIVLFQIADKKSEKEIETKNA